MPEPPRPVLDYGRPRYDDPDRPSQETGVWATVGAWVFFVAPSVGLFGGIEPLAVLGVVFFPLGLLLALVGLVAAGACTAVRVLAGVGAVATIAAYALLLARGA